MARNQNIQFYRGAQAQLPTLNPGEPGFCTDTGSLFVGTSSGNVGVGVVVETTQAAYDALDVKTPGTIYVITG